MRQRYPDTHYIKLTEEEALCDTRSNFGERDYRINYIIDDILKMQYFRGETEPVATDEGRFQSYALGQCAQSPHTLLTAYQLWRRAYYVETATLLRHLFEVFVQLRYFKNHPELLAKHWTAQTRKDRIPFRVMFDELAVDSYTAVYGKLSGIAHGNQNMMFRAELSAPTATQPEPMAYPFIGSKFDPTNSMFLHIFYISAALGFINYYGVFYPKNTIATDATLVEDLANSKQWLQSVFDNQRKLATNPALFDALEKLVIV
ncbi:MAG TPA: hypothetical protein VM911_10860 [Pyrinomonadaceae bacterium]|jgi:hypothetical protein|nr:hypothetical protein [Pyrinomonadaceae bacterium]